MGSGAKVKDGEERAATLLREALTLLEEAGLATAAFHVTLAITALESHSPSCDLQGHGHEGLQGDAFAHAVGAMAAIVGYAAQGEGPKCADAIAQAMEDHSRQIEREHLGAALLLDHWAGIVRERGGSVEATGRRDN